MSYSGGGISTVEFPRFSFLSCMTERYSSCERDILVLVGAASLISARWLERVPSVTVYKVLVLPWSTLPPGGILALCSPSADNLDRLMGSRAPPPSSTTVLGPVLRALFYSLCFADVAF